MQQNPRLADIPPARSPHNEQGCSERAHAVGESEAGLAVKLAPRSLSHPPRARQPLFFPHPTALSLSLRIDQSSAKIRESPPPLPLRPLYMPSHSHFAELSYFCIASAVAARVSRESVLFAPFICVAAPLETRAAIILSALQIMSGH
jgi:hypothetical protein